MIELTAAQLADGWVAIPDDCKGMPPALAGLKRDEWEKLVVHADGQTVSVAEFDAIWSDWLWRGENGKDWGIVAYRILGVTAPAPERAEVVIDANLPMLRRDERPNPAPVFATEGIQLFGTPRNYDADDWRQNVLTVASIGRVGSLWGEQS